jgi:hypothetical protein
VQFGTTPKGENTMKKIILGIVAAFALATFGTPARAEEPAPGAEKTEKAEKKGKKGKKGKKAEGEAGEGAGEKAPTK